MDSTITLVGKLAKTAAAGGATAGHFLDEVSIEIDLGKVRDPADLVGQARWFSGTFELRSYAERRDVLTFVAQEAGAGQPGGAKGNVELEGTLRAVETPGAEGTGYVLAGVTIDADISAIPGALHLEGREVLAEGRFDRRPIEGRGDVAVFVIASVSEYIQDHEIFGRSVSAGSGGGFSALYIEYILTRSGTLYCRESSFALHRYSFTRICSLAPEIAAGIFDYFDAIKVREIQMNEPGNMTWWVKLREGSFRHTVQWAGRVGSPTPVQVFHAMFMGIVDLCSAGREQPAKPEQGA